MDLIDPELTLSQFEALPPEIVAPLCEATGADLREWRSRLLEAVALDDPEGIRRARHALKGLCGNFGANAVMQCADGALHSAEARMHFHDCVEATIAAILTIATPLIPR